MADCHALLNIHFETKFGYGPAGIENFISETQKSYKLYTVTSTGTAAWLALISVLAIVLIILVVLKYCQHDRQG
jgi:uncharacterized membrane protein